MSDPPDPSAQVRTDYLLDEIRDVRAEVCSVRSDLQGEIRELRVETRSEIGSLRAEMRSGHNRIIAIVGVLVTSMALLVTVVQFALR